MAVSSRYRRMAEVYRIFARPWEHMLDFSDAALSEMAAHESRGAPIVSDRNGYEVGKKYLNLAVTCWKGDLGIGLITKHDLYVSGEYPHWWLDRVIRDYPVEYASECVEMLSDLRRRGVTHGR